MTYSYAVGQSGRGAGGRQEGGGARTFFSRVFSAFSSFCAFFAWRFSDFAVNCGEARQARTESGVGKYLELE